MADHYPTFAALAAAEPPGSYRIEYVGLASALVVLAPHAGKIEPGTSQVCRAIAGDERSYYLFEGCRLADNRLLHITSTRFDEPHGLAAAHSARVVLTVHGQMGRHQFVNVGGRATALGNALIAALRAADYAASRNDDQALQGLDAANVCNRGTSGEGVQLEISRLLRERLVASAPDLRRFADTVRATLAAHGL